MSRFWYQGESMEAKYRMLMQPNTYLASIIEASVKASSASIEASSEAFRRGIEVLRY
jgi:hypothetical protein